MSLTELAYSECERLRAVNAGLLVACVLGRDRLIFHRDRRALAQGQMTTWEVIKEMNAALGKAAPEETPDDDNG